MNGFWCGRSIFVTGCTGLLGSWLVQELCDRGGTVIGLIRDRVPQSRFFQEGLDRHLVSITGSVENLSLLERSLNEYEIDTVFHLAAQTIVGIANRNPISTFETNIKGTWNLLEACRRVPTVKCIIIASSDKAYGIQSHLPYTEESPLQGQHPYDVSKSCADLIANTYYHTYNLPICITRCSNLYGGGDLNFSRLIPGTIRSVLYNKRPIIRSNGQFIRDYFYIKDAVFAYLELAEKMRKIDIVGKSFNFSMERKYTVLEIVKTILRIMEKSDLSSLVLNEANHEILYQYLSSQRARELLDWTPKYKLELGLQETIKWYQDYFKKSLQEV
ncbi:MULTISPECIES: GDP-mannose 4,6-dehydratase [Spirulina sp. CCY15215]|uniref:GDP-mannose 4,6-dehydratase n=1 Tax=Spirulina sp. CCY15215 TaxID=2767591 RepID=UPI00194DFF3B|nr:GDP-mannose 4,6-dehydratase [Spirulina major]